jgi:hypothetical protein
MTDPRRMGTTGVWLNEPLKATPTLPNTPDETRRILRRAARVLRAAAAQRDPDPELLAAALLVCEAGGRRG